MSGVSEIELDERRLWIGNLDSRITEFQLLKILQKFGDIEKFDLLFHRSGPLAGQPRGYSFVTYKNEKSANLVLEKLNGQLVGSKNVSVRLAKNINYDELLKPKPKIEIPVLVAGSSKMIPSTSAEKTVVSGEPKKLSKQIAIQAIEAKLKYLENRSAVDDFELNQSRATEIPLIKKYQFNKNTQSGSGSSTMGPNRVQSTKLISKTRHKNNPYGRNNHRR